MRRWAVTVCLAFCAFFAAACGAAPQDRADAPTPTTPETGSPGTSTPPRTPSTPAPASVHANELGLVPVLMYHRIVKNPDSVYGQTPRQFRRELRRLAREGYVPVTAAAYVTGRIDIPAGKHPVVLTFDDSTAGQVSFTASGKPAKDSALGILLSVAAEHPDFRPVATFYINQNAFSLPEHGKKALRWLHEHGFELGNHSFTHANLEELSATGVQRQLAKLHRMITRAVPQAEVTTMALPFGVSPDRPKLAAHGSWHGISYDYKGVFLVGARPAPAPHNENFDPLAIPRIRAQGTSGPGHEYGSTHWLNYLEKHPRKRYTSDGDPSRLSFPKELSDQLAEDFTGNANPY